MMTRTTDNFVRDGAGVVLLPRIAGASTEARSLVQEAVAKNREHVFIDGRRMALHSESFAEALCDELRKNGVRETSFVGGSPEWQSSVAKYLD